MNNRIKILAIVVLMCLSLGLLFLPQGIEQRYVGKEPARFIISSWDYPDDYGQGIEHIGVFSNQTGAWLPANWAGDSNRYYYESSEFDWNASIFIKLECWTWQNLSVTGAADWEEGKNYHRHNVTVIDNNGTVVFSQQNFTYDGSFPAIDPPRVYYYYEVILNFLPDYGQIYTATITYEVFYLGG